MKNTLKTLSMLLVLSVAVGSLAACSKKVIEYETSASRTTPSSESSSSELVSSEEISSEEASSDNLSSDTSSEEKPRPITEIERLFGKETYDYLTSLSNKSTGWGQGVNYNDKNRPTACVNLEKSYAKYDALTIMSEDMKVYITIDEGYEYNNNTAKMLDILKEKDVQAVFFVTLSYAKKNPELIKRFINEGHIIGNHSSNHPEYPTLSLDEAYADAMKLHNYIKETYHYEMTLFRFPSGTHSEQMMALMQKMGYKTLFWSYAYKDWETANQPDPADSLAKLTERLHPGALYLIHAVSDTNVAILGDFIDNIRAAGYDISNEY